MSQMCSDKVKQIVFISEIRNPKTNASSTQIMTRNLLYGFRKNTLNLIFIAIIENKNDKTDISKYYSSLCDELLFINDITRFRTNPLMSKISMVLCLLKTKRLGIPNEILDKVGKNCIVVTHSPSIDAALVGNVIKRLRPDVLNYQYWGDPLALSLITPEQYSIRRIIQKWVERKLHKLADRVIYGTKSLADAQVLLFPEIKVKTHSVEVSYNPEETDIPDDGHDRLRIGYFGNYYSNIRNIIPFYEAARECPYADFIICGSGDMKLQESQHMQIKGRIPQNEVASEEAKLDVVVCLLNRIGVQVPGKVFYQTNTKKIILIITDGPRKREIIEELDQSGRFVFCENNKDSIKTILLKIVSGEIQPIDWDSSMYAPEFICRNIIRG